MAKCTFLRRSRGHSAEVSTAGPTTFTAITALHTTARGGGGGVEMAAAGWRRDEMWEIGARVGGGERRGERER